MMSGNITEDSDGTRENTYDSSSDDGNNRPPETFGTNRFIAEVSRSLVAGAKLGGDFAQPPLIAKGCVRLFQNGYISNEIPPLIYGSGDVQGLTILGLKYLSKVQDSLRDGEELNWTVVAKRLTVYLSMLFDLNSWNLDKKNYIARKLASIKGLKVKDKDKFYASISTLLGNKYTVKSVAPDDQKTTVVPGGRAKNTKGDKKRNGISETTLPYISLLPSYSKRGSWDNFRKNNEEYLTELANAIISILGNGVYVVGKPVDKLTPDKIIDLIVCPALNPNFPKEIQDCKNFNLSKVKKGSVSVTNYFLPFSFGSPGILKCIEKFLTSNMDLRTVKPDQAGQAFWKYLVNGGDESTRDDCEAFRDKNDEVVTNIVSQGFIFMFLCCAFRTKDWHTVIATDDEYFTDDVLTVERKF